MGHLEDNVRKTAAALESNGIDIILLGNPGVGKSTLGSTFSGSVFKSGPSWGRGCTTESAHNKDGKGRNIRWIDTPGLGDAEIREQAATEIENALTAAMHKNRGVKLVFVCFLQAGRVNPLDLSTINDVMTKIELPNGSCPGPNSYTVLFNKVDPEMMKDPDFETEGKTAIEGFFRGVKGSKGKQTAEITTNSFIYFPAENGKQAARNQSLFQDQEKNMAIVRTAEHQLVYESATLTIKKVDKIDTEAPDILKMQDDFNKKFDAMQEAFTKERADWQAQRERQDAERNRMRSGGLFSKLFSGGDNVDEVLDYIPIVGQFSRLFGKLF